MMEFRLPFDQYEPRNYTAGPRLAEPKRLYGQRHRANFAREWNTCFRTRGILGHCLSTMWAYRSSNWAAMTMRPIDSTWKTWQLVRCVRRSMWTFSGS